MVVFEEFTIKTGGKLDAVDVTTDIQGVIEASGIVRGNVLVFSPHTTCCVMLGAPGAETAGALHRMMERLAPRNGYYAHDDLTIRTENLVENEPPNAPAHIFHVIAGSASETVPVVDGRLALGDGQRVLFVELDDSRERRYCIQVIGEPV